MKKNFHSCLLKIIAIYFIIPAFIALCLYPLLPIILNYPPDSIDNKFQMEFDNITYTQQYILLISLILFCSLIILLIRTFKMYTYISILDNPSKNLSNDKTISILSKIRSLCYNTPYLLYFLEIAIPLVFLPLTFIIIKAYPLTILKICLSYISFFTLASVISFVFSKMQFRIYINTIK